MYVINRLVLMSATPYITHLRSLLHVIYVISSLVLESSTPILLISDLYYLLCT